MKEGLFMPLRIYEQRINLSPCSAFWPFSSYWVLQHGIIFLHCLCPLKSVTGVNGKNAEYCGGKKTPLGIILSDLFQGLERKIKSHLIISILNYALSIFWVWTPGQLLPLKFPLKKTLYGEQNWFEQVQLSGRAHSFHREKPAFIGSLSKGY